MKKLTVKGKLSLNKETIAKLSNEEMLNAKGATGQGCTITCSGSACPTAGTTTNHLTCCVPPCW